MRILVTGATGSVGRHVVDFLYDAGAEVRALSRRPDSAALPAGVQVVAGDLEQPDTVRPALEGVERMYLVVAGDTRQLAREAKAAGVRRIVLLSSATAAHEAGAFHRAAEVAVEESGLEWTHLRPGLFAGNFLDWAEAIRADGVVRAPYDAARQSPVHELDVAEVAATVLLSDGDTHAGRIYPLSGPESLTKAEQVAALGKGAGRPIGYQELTPDEWRVQAGMPSYAVDWLLGWWAQTLDNPEPVLTGVQDVLGRPARSLAGWAADHAEEFRA